MNHNPKISDSICHESWILNPKEKQGHGYRSFIYQWYTDNQHWIKADIKINGCIDLMKAYNLPFPNTKNDDVDCIHICNIDEFIKQLTLLKQTAEKEFNILSSDAPR